MTRDEYGQAYQRGFELTIRFLRSIGVQGDRAKEVAQAAWTLGWERLSQLRNDSFVRTWVNAIALNVYRGILRREPVYGALPELHAKAAVNLAAIDVARILKICRPCDRALLEQQMRGVTAEEIARQEGVTETAIRIRLLRARRAARTRVESRRAALVTGAVMTTLLFAFSAFARGHSALNGTWTLVPTQSDFAGQPVVQTGTVTINDREGVIVVSRSFVYEGATQTSFYSDSTGSENNATIHTGKDIKTKTRWDHGVLRVTTSQSGAITLESYNLAADGTMMVSVVRPEHKPIVLVFQRK